MQPPANQTFYRGADRILGGVCSGLAQGFHVEPLWVRLAFVLLTFLNGIGLLLYVVLWVLMPERIESRPPGQGVIESMGSDLKRAWADLRMQFRGQGSPTPQASNAATPAPSSSSTTPAAREPSLVAPPHQSTRNPSFIFGAILIVIGIAFLAANTNFVNWSVVWPAALVAVGIGLLIRNLERK
jgi:phage shock protein PspC (stress-responsive transcriptional regulator)